MTKPTPPDDGERRVLGRYRLTDRLATGGSAEVWRAHDEQLQRDEAMQVFRTWQDGKGQDGQGKKTG